MPYYAFPPVSVEKLDLGPNRLQFSRADSGIEQFGEKPQIERETQELLEWRLRRRHQAPERRRLGLYLGKFFFSEYGDIDVADSGKFVVRVLGAGGRSPKQSLEIGIIAEVEFPH